MITQLRKFNFYLGNVANNIGEICLCASCCDNLKSVALEICVITMIYDINTRLTLKSPIRLLTVDVVLESSEYLRIKYCCLFNTNIKHI